MVRVPIKREPTKDGLVVMLDIVTNGDFGMKWEYWMS